MIIGLLQDSFNVGNMCMIGTLRTTRNIKKETNRQNLLYILNTSTILVIQFIGTVIIWVVGAQEVFKREYDHRYHYGIDELPNNYYESYYWNCTIC